MNAIPLLYISQKVVPVQGKATGDMTLWHRYLTTARSKIISELVFSSGHVDNCHPCALKALKFFEVGTKRTSDRLLCIEVQFSHKSST